MALVVAGHSELPILEMETLFNTYCWRWGQLVHPDARETTEQGCDDFSDSFGDRLGNLYSRMHVWMARMGVCLFEVEAVGGIVVGCETQCEADGVPTSDSAAPCRPKNNFDKNR